MLLLSRSLKNFRRRETLTDHVVKQRANNGHPKSHAKTTARISRKITQTKQKSQKHHITLSSSSSTITTFLFLLLTREGLKIKASTFFNFFSHYFWVFIYLLFGRMAPPRFGLMLLLLLLLLASAMVEESAAALFSETNWGYTHFTGGDLGGRRACNGLVGDCINPDAEAMMSSETSRRTLAQGGRFISYAALKKNNVPCNRRGTSYYNCVKGGKANPYRRGCSVITRCARFTD